MTWEPNDGRRRKQGWMVQAEVGYILDSYKTQVLHCRVPIRQSDVITWPAALTLVRVPALPWPRDIFEKK